MVRRPWEGERDVTPSSRRSWVANSVALSRFLDGNPDFTRPQPVPPPGCRGGMTIFDIHSAPDSPAHLDLVREWAREAWESWSTHHEQARVWMNEAKRRGRSRP